MALLLEAVSTSGVVQRTPITGGRVKVTAQQGFTYRVIDDSGARFDQNVAVKRDRNTLLIDGLPGDQVVELDGFFFNCVPSAPCTFVTENIGGAANITPGSEPVGALLDGTFMMYSRGPLPTPAVAAPEAEWSPRSLLLGAGLLAGLGLAGGGGGGGGGGSGSSGDSTPPATPLLTSGNLTKDARPVLAGTAEPGSVVIISLDIDGNGVADVTYETRVDGNGVWSVDLSTATPIAQALPPDGLPDAAAVRIIMRARDDAGNISPQAASETLLIDRSPPAQTATISSYVDDQAEFTGAVANNGVSNDQTPTLSGTINAALAAGDRIEVLRNGVVVGQATVTGTVWTFTETLPAGLAQAASYTVRAADALGNGGVQSSPLIINVDTLAPAAPVIATVTGDDLVNLAEAGTPITLSGTSEAGATLRVGWGGRTFNATAGSDGQWQVLIPVNEIPGNGTRPVEATAIDAAGNAGATAIRTVGVVTGLPSVPTVSAVAVDNRINATEATSPVVVSGIADPGNLVTLTWGAIPGTRTVTAAQNGTWSVTYSVTDIALLAQGASNLVASAQDLANNVRTAPAVSIDKDTVVPAQIVVITAVTDNQPLVTGTVASGGTTNDQTPTLSGTLSGGLAAGESLRVFRGATEVGAAVVTGTTWTFTDTLTANTSHTYTARVVDAAGNLGAFSAGYSITLDSVAPTVVATITGILDNVAPVTGTLTSGGSGNDTSPTLSGTLSGALAPGESLRIFRGATEVGTATVSGSAWTFTDSSGGFVSATSYTYTAQVSDAAGNSSAPGNSFVYVFDATAPAAPGIGVVAGNDAISLAESSLPVTISGTTEAGASVSVVWGATTLTTTATAGGSYSVTFSSVQIPPNGSTTVSVTAADAAGNVSTPATRTVLVDRVAPVAPTIGVVAGDDLVSGAERAAGVVISGTAEAGSTIAISWGSTTLTTTASGGGTYSQTFTSGQMPASGPTVVSVVSTDAAGNTNSGTRNVVVASDPPSQTATVTAIVDATAPLTGTVASGGRTNDPDVTVNGSLSAALGVGQTVQVLRDGTVVGTASVTGTTWTFAAPAASANGTTYVYSARVIDGTGNTGAVANTYSVTFDNVSTTPTINAVATDNRVNATEAAGPVVVAGTAEAGSTVAVVWGAATLTATATGGNYSVSFASGQIPADGSPIVSVTATDAAGNVSTAATQTVLVDRLAPAAPVIATTIAGDNVIDFGERTGGVVVSGTAEANSSVAITWGATTQTVTTTGGGTFTATFTGAQVPGTDGPSTISAVATDLSGNIGPAGTRAVVIDIDSSFSGTAAANTLALSSLIVANLTNPATVLDGAGGIDTLSFGSAGLALNLNAVGNSQVVSFERVDLTGAGANALTLSTGDVLSMGGANLFTGAGWVSTANPLVTLTNAAPRTQIVIDGEAGDSVTASGGWTLNAINPAGTVTNGGVTYAVYDAGAGASAVQLLIDTAVTQNIT